MNIARKLQVLAIGSAVALAVALLAWTPRSPGADRLGPKPDDAAPALLAALADTRDERPEGQPVPARVHATSVGTLLHELPH